MPILTVTHYNSVKERTDLLKKLNVSGLSVFEFANANGLNYRAVCKWRAHVRPGNCDFNQTWFDIYNGKITLDDVMNNFKQYNERQFNADQNITITRIDLSNLRSD